jgi:hypothetical protein
MRARAYAHAMAHEHAHAHTSTHLGPHGGQLLGRRPARVLLAEPAHAAQLVADERLVRVRHAQVGELGHHGPGLPITAAAAQQHVLALDVAVNLAARVQVTQRLGQLHRPPPHVAGRRAQSALQVAAAAELQHDGAERRGLVHAHAQQLHHARVVHQRQVQRLPVERAHGLLLAKARQLPRYVRHVQQLDGHGHARARAQKNAAVHHAKGAVAEPRAQLQALARDEARQQQRRQAGRRAAAGGVGVGGLHGHASARSARARARTHREPCAEEATAVTVAMAVAGAGASAAAAGSTYALASGAGVPSDMTGRGSNTVALVTSLWNVRLAPSARLLARLPGCGPRASASSELAVYHDEDNL